MDIKEIQNLIRFVARSGATEVNLETEEFKINIKTSADQAAMPEQAVVQHVAQVIPAAPVAAVTVPGINPSRSKTGRSSTEGASIPSIAFAQSGVLITDSGAGKPVCSAH